MTNIHSNPTPSRQKFIEYLTLNRKAERTVHTYVSSIYSLARHSRRSPDLLGPEDIRRWLHHLTQVSHASHQTRINRASDFFGTTKSPPIPLPLLFVEADSRLLAERKQAPSTVNLFARVVLSRATPAYADCS